MSDTVTIVVDNGVEKITYKASQNDADRVTNLLDRALGRGKRES